MIIYEGLEALKGQVAGSTVAIGTFDGVHLGHQAIVTTAVQNARAHQRPAVVFTFDRHPAELLAPERAPHYITTPGQRNRIIEQLGVDLLVVARFDRSLSELSPDEFLRGILKERLGAEAIVEGHDFAFGKNRQGTVQYLETAQHRFGFELMALQPVFVAGTPATSSRIRALISEGAVAEAAEVLGRPFALEGVVVSGAGLGRALGFPTANVQTAYRQIVPGDGVYTVLVELSDGRKRPGACSIGNRPAVPGSGWCVETYVLDFDEQIYGQSITFHFVEKLRDQRDFPDITALISQIETDVQRCRELLPACEAREDKATR